MLPPPVRAGAQSLCSHWKLTLAPQQVHNCGVAVSVHRTLGLYLWLETQHTFSIRSNLGLVSSAFLVVFSTFQFFHVSVGT